MPFATSKQQGHPIEIRDEGSPITTDAESINFAGAGVSAVGDPDVTVTIPGGGASLVTVTGTIDDSNTSFTAASEPTVLVINGGTYQKTGGTITWTYSTGTITLSSAVGTGGTIYGLA